ncbi:hypothetical protein cyc_04723 [Cyclospora cayetanensis]|uniref:Uncharacterized protein n=1 Tax=Cyclospora cayetanensis TaxID=88456 RepID=A0A1D3D531_9EIME|nr:hypothetical protein cyc_04723 [Cyclospora cayetanensis]
MAISPPPCRWVAPKETRLIRRRSLRELEASPWSPCTASPHKPLCDVYGSNFLESRPCTKARAAALPASLSGCVARASTTRRSADVNFGPKAPPEIDDDLCSIEQSAEILSGSKKAKKNPEVKLYQQQLYDAIARVGSVPFST